ncbi:MAG: hypothetical protein H8M99_14460 [Gloeobacteraceae cyanobacterium ES-bin-144]|nr:hypothetical protein [Verrucomicrobiales bacterium]
MSAFAEFLLIAVLLFLWESTLWLPLRGIALRKRWIAGRWSVLDPSALLSFRKTGLVPMFPLPPDFGLAPCQGPPLIVAPDGGMLMETDDGYWIEVVVVSWADFQEEGHCLVVAGRKTRLTSRRWLEILKRARQRGADPVDAVRLAAKLAFSPTRASRELRKWHLVSKTLRWTGLLLTVGFFVGLPMIYLYRGSLDAMLFVLWLWLVMCWISGQLWWLAARVYPGAKSALRMDALLALLVPFHAMRAMEIASVHSFGTTHPLALLVSAGDMNHPWLQRFLRKLEHVKPTEHASVAALRPLVSMALATRGKVIADFDVMPDASKDLEAVKYCPRCHGMFLGHAMKCGECDLPLRDLTDAA